MINETLPPASGEPAPKRRRLQIALIASLAINLLVAGAVAGGLYAARHGYGPRAMGEFGLMRFSHSLSGDRRNVIHGAISDRWSTLKPMREAVGRARRAFSVALSTEPFDKVAIDAATKAVIEAETQLRTARLAIITDTAEKLSPDERRAFEAWKKTHKGRWSDPKPHGGGAVDGPPWQKD